MVSNMRGLMHLHRKYLLSSRLLFFSLFLSDYSTGGFDYGIEFDYKSRS